MDYIPEGHNHVSPYLVVKNGQPVIDFLKTVFNAEQIYLQEDENGQIIHTELRIKDSVIMIGEAGENYTPTENILHIYVEDVDETYSNALNWGATSINKPEDKPEGDRRGSVRGPEGNNWSIATKIK